MLSFLAHPGNLLSLRKPASKACDHLRCKYASFPTQFSRRTAARAAATPSADTVATRDALQKFLSNGLGVVVLKGGKCRYFRESRSMQVYSGAIERTKCTKGRTLGACAPVAVCDGRMKCLGLGFFNPYSMFRVRMLRLADMRRPDLDVSLPWDIAGDIRKRLDEAIALRDALALPHDRTDVYRVINGDGDRLSGLVVDRFANTLVVSVSALWCEHYRQEIMAALQGALPECVDVVWRRNEERLKQDGFIPVEEEGLEATTDNGTPSATEGATGDDECVQNEEEIVVKENGVLYGMPRQILEHGQKTGHYVDQRENRRYIRDLLSRRQTAMRVLDLCSYTGGFAVNAALAGDHVSVTCVDSSKDVLALGERNAERNGVRQRVQFSHGDVSKVGRALLDAGERYDMIILDPPKLAPSAKVLTKATYKYRSLNATALRLASQGALLCTCTCSAAMTKERGRFVQVVKEAAHEAGREVRLVKTIGAAADHPVTPEMMEAEYLTMCVFCVT